MQVSRTNLESLPPEILHQIHFQAQNPNLALVSKTTNAYLRQPYTTAYYTATYLLDLYSKARYDLVLAKALVHPVCTVKVAVDIKRIWDKRRGYVEPPPPPPAVVDAGLHVNEPIPQAEPIRSPTRPDLSISDLPRRLFRNLTSTTPIPPLLEYLFTTFSPSANSYDGYPLCRAVLAKNAGIIKYLLSKGADPGMRDGLAIEIAVKLGNLEIVRMLVEHQSNIHSEAQVQAAIQGREGQVMFGSGSGMEIPAKWVETAVKIGSDEIVSYFVHEKGVMPPLHSIMQLGRIDRKRKLLDMSQDEGKKKSKSSHRKSYKQGDTRFESNNDTRRITKSKPKNHHKNKGKAKA